MSQPEVVNQETVPAEVPLRRLSPLTPVARSGIFIAAVAYTAGRNIVDGEPLGVIAGILVAVLLAGLGLGFFAWWRTFFRITDTELRLDTGLISRQSRRVRLDRIVAIDVNQPFIARLLGLAELRIETATTDADVKLAFLRLAEAQEIRRVLLAHRGSGVTTQEGEVATDEAARPLIDIPLSWHLISVLASGEAIAFVVMSGVVLGLIALGPGVGALGGGVVALGGAGLALVRKLVGRWKWRVGALPTGLQVRHGLFNVTTQTFNVSRLQGVRMVEPLLWRPWGLAALEVSVAGGAKGEGEDILGGTVLPAAPVALVRRLAADLIGHDATSMPTTPSPRRARFVTPVSWRWNRFGLDDRYLVSRRGVLSPKWQVLPLARVQSFRAEAGPVQRRFGLVNLVFDTPDGASDLMVSDRDSTTARADLELAMAYARERRVPLAASGRVASTGFWLAEPGLAPSALAAQEQTSRHADPSV